MRFQGDEHPALIERSGRATGADVCADGSNRRILLHDTDHSLDTLNHGRKRNILPRLGDADDHPGVLLREKALGNDDVEIARERDRPKHHHQRDEAVAQGNFEAALIDVQQAVEAPFSLPVEPPMLPAGFTLEQAGAHHRREA